MPDETNQASSFSILRPGARRRPSGRRDDISDTAPCALTCTWWHGLHTVGVLLLLMVVPIVVHVHSDTLADGTWLAALYTNTNGPSWTSTCRTGWNISYPESVCGGTTAWHGVTCGGSSVTSVDLSSCNLQGGPIPDIPPLVAGHVGTALQYCRTLYLHSNSITGTLPSSLSSISGIYQMYLNSNRLTGTVPSSYGSLTALQHLYLSSNSLTGTLPDSLKSLSALRVLYLSSNTLTGTLPWSWYQLQPLSYTANWYDLSNNNLTGDIPLSWLWSNATIGGSYIASNCVIASNMAAVTATARFASGTPSYSAGVCAAYAAAQAASIPKKSVSPSRTPEKSGSYSSSWVLSESKSVSTSVSQSLSPLATMSWSRSLSTSPTRSLSVSTPQTLSTSSSVDLSSISATKSLSASTSQTQSVTRSSSITETCTKASPSTTHMRSNTLKSPTVTASKTSSPSQTWTISRSRSTTPTVPLSQTSTLSRSTTRSPPTASLVLTPSGSMTASPSPSVSVTRVTFVHSATSTCNETTPTVTGSVACRDVAPYNTSVVQSLIVPAASPWQQQQRFEVATVCAGGGGTVSPCSNTTTTTLGRRDASSLTEYVGFNFQKSWETAVRFPVTFVVRLSAPVGRFSTIKHDVGTAVSSALRLTATLNGEDSVVMVLTEDRLSKNSAASSVFSSQSVHLEIPVSVFACIGAESPLWTLSVSVSLAGQRLAVALSSLESAGGGASVAAYASLSPSAGTTVSRAALLGKLLDCTASDPTQDAGNGVVGTLMFGDAVGQYMRGAIAGNVAVLIGSCAVLVLFGVAVGALSGLRRGVPLASSCLLALDTLHLPGVFAVPLSQLLQPTVAACVSLLIVRGDVNSWDVAMSLLGIVSVLMLPVFFVLVLLRNPCCTAVRRRAAFVEAVQLQYFSSKNALRCFLPLWRLTKRWFVVNVRWLPTRLDQAGQAKQWKRRYLLLFEDYRVLWYPALDIATSVGFGIVSGFVGAMGSRAVCAGASMVTLFLYLVLVVAAAVFGVGASRFTNAIFLTVNGLGLIASAALTAYTFKPSRSAADVAVVCLMISSVIVTVISVPSFCRVVIRLFWFIHRHLWMTWSVSHEGDSKVHAMPTIADVVIVHEDTCKINNEEEEVPAIDKDLCSSTTSTESSCASPSEQHGGRKPLPFAEIEVDAAYLNSAAAMLRMWQQEEEQQDGQESNNGASSTKKGSGASSWLDDIITKSTSNELDLLLHGDLSPLSLSEEQNNKQTTPSSNSNNAVVVDGGGVALAAVAVCGDNDVVDETTEITLG